MSYTGFISYSRADSSFAEWLFQILETTPSPRGGPKRKRKFFLDRAEIVPGPSLPTRLSDALKSSQWLVVILTPAAAQSAWVNQEIETFAGAVDPQRILGIVRSGEPSVRPISGQSCIPQALAAALPDNPLFADARRSSVRDNQKRFAAFQILAAIDGVPLDAYLQRDVRRKRNSALMMTGAAALAIAATTGLAYRSSRVAEADQLLVQARTMSGMERVRALVAAARISESVPFAGRSEAWEALAQPQNRIRLGVIAASAEQRRADYDAYSLGESDPRRSDTITGRNLVNTLVRLNGLDQARVEGVAGGSVGVRLNPDRTVLEFVGDNSVVRGRFILPTTYRGQPVSLSSAGLDVTVSPSFQRAVIDYRVEFSETYIEAERRRQQEAMERGETGSMVVFTEDSQQVVIDIETGEVLLNYSEVEGGPGQQQTFQSDNAIVDFITGSIRRVRLTPEPRVQLLPMWSAVRGLSGDGRTIYEDDAEYTLEALDWDVRRSVDFFCEHAWPGYQVAPDSQFRRQAMGASAARPCA